MLMFGVLAIEGELPESKKLDLCLRKIADGDMTALETLYEETRVGVYSYALSVVKNREDAEDVLQEVYLSVFKSASSYRSKDKPMAWLLTVTKNLCLSKIRRRVSTVSFDREVADLADAITSAEDRIALSACLKKLDDDERQIVVLHAVSGLKIREIAALTELPPGTVSSKYARAVKKLGEELTKGGMEP